MLYACVSNCSAVCLKQDNPHLQLNPWWVKKRILGFIFLLGVFPLCRIPIPNLPGCSVWMRDVLRECVPREIRNWKEISASKLSTLMSSFEETLRCHLDKTWL